MNLFQIVLIIIFMAVNTSIHAYETAISARQVKEQILAFDENRGNAVVLLDIDDTIITPKSLTFRNSPYNKIIDEIKANRDKYPNYEEIVSNWRLQREVMLIDPDWPEILNDLKSNYRVFGLTKMNTGKFGNISSMEEWRYNELKSLDITFSEHDVLPEAPTDNQPSFFEGILMTGTANKRNTLKRYISIISSVETVVFVDDREGNLQELDAFCNENNIKFLGIHYQGLQRLGGKQDEEVFLLQKNTLINQAKWLSDEEARLQLAK